MDFPKIDKTTDTIESSEGLPIRYDVYTPKEEDPSPLPVILFLHGFKGFKDWGTFPAVCSWLSRAGFAVIAMNFSLNGIGNDPMSFDRLDLFARDTFSQDLDDLGAVIAAVHQEEITAMGEPLNPNEMGILGHSRGGQTAIAAAAEYPEISCLVTWSAVADYNARWDDAMKRDWERKGVTEVKNGRTGQMMPMKKIIYEDARENADRVIALNRMDELTLPVLLVHSKDDEAVPYHDAKRLFEVCPSPEKELLTLRQTGHTFGGAHPFKSETFPERLQQAVSKTTDWFVHHLK